MSTGNQILKLPKTLYLESTNRCNLRCGGCVLYRNSQEPKRDLSLDEAVMITDQLADLEKIFLHGIGEPLLNPELLDIIRRLKGRDVYVLFNSNATLLNDRMARALIQTGLDELRVSLDAATAGGYQKIRGSDKFEQVLENLRSFVLLQKRQRVVHPKLSLWFLGTRDNIAELPGFVKLAAGIGIGEVYLQRLVYFQDDVGYGLARDCKSLQDSHGGTLALIEESRDLAVKLGIQFNASGSARPGESLHGQAAADMPWTRCYRPSTLMYITANGNVLPCCIAPFATVDYASIVLGNVFKQPLEEIWSGSGYTNFRKRHQSGAPPQCCLGCGVRWSL
ncbi:MAG: radical SAM protein [Desulfobacterales bacterium]|jgi:radical SAM protein with 4Fe4S-binding SPASM domain